MPNIKILANSWYSSQILPKPIDSDEYLNKNYKKYLLNLSNKIRIIKIFLFFHASKKFDVIVAPLWMPGFHYYLILEALLSKKRNRVIILEFIRPIPQNKTARFFYSFIKLILSPVLRRTLLSAQVLSKTEINLYARNFKIKTNRFSFIPWPLHFNQIREPEKPLEIFKSVIDDNQKYVMVSGLNNVDWETIFEVAENSDWQLLAVCSKRHLQRVSNLNKNKKAIILNDISQYEHAQYVKHATVYALCLEEHNVSVGQIRLMNTIEHGIPVVASNVTGLQDYAVDGVNSLLVPPGDSTAFKNALDRLIENPDFRKKLVQSAKEYQTARTFERYLNEVSSFIKNSSTELYKKLL